ncbi:hypothetical protein ACOME3_009246, partial [Neoechinorhynchus agilis]
SLMPTIKSKEFIDSSNDEAIVDPHDLSPSKKRPKIDVAETKSNRSKDTKEFAGLLIGQNKYVTVNEFKGSKLVDIREYYVEKSDGKLKPGRKGISLKVAQWDALKGMIDQIDKMLK